MRVVLICLLSITCIGLSAQSYSIGNISTTVTDPSRNNRSIPIEIFYPSNIAGLNVPVANGAFPLIVFGHGFSMNYNPYQNLWDELVPQGYIMVFPKTEIGPIPFPDHAAFGQDLSFIVNLFKDYNTQNNSPFYTKLNGNSALMGHSMGGGCSFLAAEANPNITTLISFAPAETNTSAITAATNINIPTLLFAGGNDNVAPPVNNSTPMYNNLASDCKHHITITNGAHCHFANSNTACDFGEVTVCIGCSFIGRPTQHNIVFRFLIPWLNFYLKNNCIAFTEFEHQLNSSNDVSTQSQCNYQLPTAQISLIGDSIFCEGDSSKLLALGNYENLWSTSDTTPIITVKDSGNYTLIITDSIGCRDTSIVQPIRLKPVPSIQFLIAGVIPLCESNLPIKVTASVSGNAAPYTYLWSDSSTNNYTLANTDTIWLQTTNNFGCTSIDSVKINALPNPDTATILWDSSLLSLTVSAKNYQWYLNNMEIQGATDSIYVPNTNGVYTCKLISDDNCSSFSYPFSLTLLTNSIKTTYHNVIVYPNPTDGTVIIEGVFDHFYLYNYTGNMVLHKKTHLGTKTTLNLHDVTPGVYIMAIYDNKSIKYFKLVVTSMK